MNTQKQPFKTLQRITLRIEKLESPEEAAFLQYQLLCNPLVLQCHVEFATQRAVVLCQANSNPAELIEKTLRGKKVCCEKTEPILYEQLLSDQFH